MKVEIREPHLKVFIKYLVPAILKQPKSDFKKTLDKTGALKKDA